MKIKTNKYANQYGLSLVELMISMALGLVVSAGTVSIYISSSQSYSLNTAKTLMQENANFAMHFFEDKFNSAAVGNAFSCDESSSITNTIWDTNTNAAYDTGLIFSGGIRGYSVEENETGLIGGIDVETVTENTDFLVFSGLDMSTADTNVRVITATAANFKLDKTLSVNIGQVLAVMEPDCSEVAILMSSKTSDQAKINHNTGIESNGLTNCSKYLQGGFTCTGSGNNNTTGGESSNLYSNDAILATLDSTSTAFTVQPVVTEEGTLNSLFKIDVNAGTEQEMVRGVNSLELLYGMNTDTANTGRAYVGQYMTADQVDASGTITWDDLLTVKVRLTMSSETKVSNVDGSRDFMSQDYERIFTIKSRVL